jgi:hypothetical protein
MGRYKGVDVENVVLAAMSLHEIQNLNSLAPIPLDLLFVI